MSHIATVDVQIRDLDALDRACQRLGLEFRRDQTTYKWWGNTGPRADLTTEQLTRLIREYDKSFERPDFMSAEDWRAGNCLHAIGLPGSDHGFEIGLTKSPSGTSLTMLGDLSLLAPDFAKRVGGPTCGKLTQAYSVEVAKRAMQLKGFRVQESTLSNGNVQLTCLK